jgi:hypothetical protein
VSKTRLEYHVPNGEQENDKYESIANNPSAEDIAGCLCIDICADGSSLELNAIGSGIL